MRRIFTCVIVLVTATAASAQQGAIGTSAANPKHIPSRFFKIPFGLPNNAEKIRQLKLYISANGGATWELHGTAGPFQKYFDVRVERDGPYAFAIQTVFSTGDLAPADVTALRGSQFVVVDTEKPAIMLKALPTRPSVKPGYVDVGVQWDVRDENLDPQSIRLEVRWLGQGVFVPIRDRTIGPQGEDERSIPSMGRMEVRLTARDFAQNSAEQTIVVGSGMGTTGRIGEPPARDPSTSDTTTPGRPKTNYLNSKKIVLEFRVVEKGLSGVASTDLWITRDGRDWRKATKEADKLDIKLPTDSEKATASIVVADDGLYGFALIATSLANLSIPAPTSAKDVQTYVKVDTKPPEAKLIDVRFSQPTDPQYLAISWQASDENLGATPITLQYSLEEKPVDDQKWLNLTDDLLANSGRQVVKTPGIPGFQFWVRLKVVDLAGNQTVVPFPKPIILDTVRPRIEILDAMPGK